MWWHEFANSYIFGGNHRAPIILWLQPSIVMALSFCEDFFSFNMCIESNSIKSNFIYMAHWRKTAIGQSAAHKSTNYNSSKEKAIKNMTGQNKMTK